MASRATANRAGGERRLKDHGVRGTVSRRAGAHYLSLTDKHYALVAPCAGTASSKVYK
jgi:hypothetical protein